MEARRIQPPRKVMVPMKQFSLRVLLKAVFVASLGLGIITRGSISGGDSVLSAVYLLSLLLTLGVVCIHWREFMEMRAQGRCVACASSIICAFGFLLCSFATALAVVLVTSAIVRHAR